MRKIGILLLLFLNLWVNAQGPEKKHAFSSPVDFKIFLSGTFGELRTDHFHSGMDIRTSGSSGHPIRSVADGHIARIKVSPGGFGKTLYISHPNGYMSVYAHLDQFNKNIEEYVRLEQYRQESFSVNLFPEKDRFPVKRGQIIARSGNSGYSFGPHLHFEIRDDDTQEPLNPQLFGFLNEDRVRPIFRSIRLYQQDDSLKGYLINPMEFRVRKNGIRQFLEEKDTIYVSCDFYLGVDVYDQANRTANKNGIYSLTVLIDSEVFYDQRMDRFRFGDTRYINSLIDYGEYVKSKRRFIRTKVDPNNKLRVYRKIHDDGIIKLKDDQPHKISIIASDISGNNTELTFFVAKKGNPDSSLFVKTQEPLTLLSWRDETVIDTNNMRLEVPAYALYDHVDFVYTVEDQCDGYFSHIHTINNNAIPLHKYAGLSLRVVDLPDSLQSKAVLVRLDEEGNPESAGGEYCQGFVNARIREFGKYAVAVDTTPPEIKVKDQGLSILKTGMIRCYITDDLSGIKSYKAFMNGDWILMEYDLKNDMLIYRRDDMLKPGINEFVLEVEDEKENKSVFTLEIHN